MGSFGGLAIERGREDPVMFMLLGTAGRGIGPEVEPSQAFYLRGRLWRGGDSGKLLSGEAINI